MKTVHIIDDIQQVYAEFLENNHYPKLESLSNWGKNRFFFNLYFSLIQDCHHTEQIVIELNHKLYRLETAGAPDFMDREKYIWWLKQELLHQYAVSGFA